MMSGAISTEVTRRPPGVLLTTPITRLQLVVGKFLGNVLQMVLLLAVSFPLMTFLRIRGGISLWYVVSVSAITFTSILFFAAVTLYCSARI